MTLSRIIAILQFSRKAKWKINYFVNCFAKLFENGLIRSNDFDGQLNCSSQLTSKIQFSRPNWLQWLSRLPVLFVLDNEEKLAKFIIQMTTEKFFSLFVAISHSRIGQFSWISFWKVNLSLALALVFFLWHFPADPDWTMLIFSWKLKHFSSNCQSLTLSLLFVVGEFTFQSPIIKTELG